MAELVSLGRSFGGQSRIINVPGPLEKFPGSQQAGQALGLGLARFLGKRKQGQLEKADRALLGRALGGDNVTADSLSQALSGFQSDKFRDIASQLMAQQLSRTLDPTGQQQREATLGKTRAETERLGRPDIVSPTQQLARERLDAFNAAKAIPKGQRTPDQQKTIDDVIRPKGPLVQIGGLPGGFQFLTPEEQKTQARSELKKKVAPKPLTPTEQKGVQATVDSIVGESKALPFGAKPGPALKQDDVGALWENTMEATGYVGRDRIQRGQIENTFDRKISTLNKGKGIGVLAKQYQWSRGLYNKTHRKPGESIDAFVKRTGL